MRQVRLFVCLLILLIFNVPSVRAEFPHSGTYLGLDSKVAESYSQFDNQLVLIEAFATWCLPCKSEQYELSLVDATFNSGPQANITIFSLSVSPGTDTLNKIQAFKSDAEDEFDFIADWEFGLDIRKGTEENFAEAFGIGNIIPTTLLISPDGVLEKKWEGLVTASQLISYIDANITFEGQNQAVVFFEQIVSNVFFQVFIVTLIILITYRLFVPKYAND